MPPQAWISGLDGCVPPWVEGGYYRRLRIGQKQLHHPVVGAIGMEYSAFAVDGRPDLGMVIYNPMTPEDADKARTLIRQKKRS